MIEVEVHLRGGMADGAELTVPYDCGFLAIMYVRRGGTGPFGFIASADPAPDSVPYEWTGSGVWLDTMQSYRVFTCLSPKSPSEVEQFQGETTG